MKRSELDPNKTYVAYSPKGTRIIGTSDIVPGTARASRYSVVDGKVVPEYDGYTDVCWDAQETQKRDGEYLFTCEDGDDWKESQLTFEEGEE